MWGRGPGRRHHLPRPPVTTFELTTERTRLREFVPEDLDALAPIFADEVMMEWYPHPFSRAESAFWIERNQRRYREDGFGLWALELRGSGDLLGDCGLVKQRVDDIDEIEIGWHVKRESWGRGYAPEAALAVANHAFAELSVPHLISLIRPENVNSARVAEKLGMHVWKETTHADLRHFVFRLDRDAEGE